MMFENAELNKQWRKLVIIHRISIIIFIACFVSGIVLTYNYVESKGGVKQIIVDIGKNVKDIKTKISKE